MTPPARARVLVVDDQLEMAQMLADQLRDRGYDAVAIASGREAVVRLEREAFDAVVTDLRMPDADGMEVLAAARRSVTDRPVIVMTAYSAIDTAIESFRQGAYHYLTKPFKLDELVIFLGRALDEMRVRREAIALRRTSRHRSAVKHIVGSSRPVQTMLDVISRVADAKVAVLITGETGTGKGLVARALHSGSVRSTARFVAVNCAALPEPLLESELFGHVKGAFTGASEHRQGLFAEAQGGTLFLDEIGDMPLALQAKLLHALESGSVRPLGSSRELPVDVRVVAATNRDLRQRASTGAFREDLLYRLDVVSIEVPPLRHRREDLPALVEHFLAAARESHPTSPVHRFAPAAIRRLFEHPWPGNIRELAHVVERVVVLGRGEEVSLEDLPPALSEERAPGRFAFSGDIIPVRELQRRYAAWVLEQMGGHKGRTAEKLNIDDKTLARWLTES